MNSFEINKILGALLGTCLVLVAVHIAAGAIFTQEAPAKPGYEIAVQEQTPEGGAAAKPKEEPIENLLASASPERGAQVAKQCQACHNFQEGQGKKVGPDLYGVVGRKIASVQDFNYSSALKSKTGEWNFDLLNTWLAKPSAFAPGTAMTFAGLSNEKQRADVIAYLNSLSANPKPLPKPQEQKPEDQKPQQQGAAAPQGNAPPPASANPAAGAPANSPAGAAPNQAPPAPANPSAGPAPAPAPSGGAPSQH